ncbi:excinuclease ABC subunit A [candidate division Kazan bacterium RBG_13_50_9]|uniref:UvrABC system protein A n=1 Tax=candidate division Kazan bacterium RBG_13_50_9 TaxID=1798535 RepID=A0A1F4NRC6_UNCK3|nr:MAG: excinuclease ABC subunit A [candidate division Kazan bacterium RBG_13_50_9]
MLDYIDVRGAREHNLKNIDVKLPRNRFIVITGLSGSGKSSLAFDTIYAEGQRRYVESLSAYARQFLGVMEKPNVERIDGLSPAISIDQKSSSANPRSTVGTITEIYDYLRLLFARIGVPHCPQCGAVVARQSIDQIVAQVQKLPLDKFAVLAPLVADRKGEAKEALANIKKAGFLRARIDGVMHNLEETTPLPKTKKHTIDAVIDRLELTAVRDQGGRGRLTRSLEAALEMGNGTVIIWDVDGDREWFFSENLACAKCGISIPELAPRSFSFNNPYGACPRCTGLGYTKDIDPDLLIPNKQLTISEGAIRAGGFGMSSNGWVHRMLAAVGGKYGFRMDQPISQFSKRALNALLYGSGDEEVTIRYRTAHGNLNEYVVRFEGVIPNLLRRYKDTDSEFVRAEIDRSMVEKICPECQGGRLKKEFMAVTVGELSIVAVANLSVRDVAKFFKHLRLNPQEALIAQQILKELQERVSFLDNVGLGYLTLSRSATTLAGGEAQRIRLATQIGSGLSGVIYILDEPSIGLHQHDNKKLIRSLKGLRDIGNTIIVVEHDEETILSADYVVDMGPGAGALGGEVVAHGTPLAIKKNPKSLTGLYLSGKRKIEVPPVRRVGNGKRLTIRGASEFNLQDIDVEIPLGLFVCVTGLSGSGKSTLVGEILVKKLSNVLHGARQQPGKHRAIEGISYLDKVISIDQSPIGRSPRSNPATYTGVFTDIRDLFSKLPEAQIKGYAPGRFSFNVRGGRCENCQGDGVIKIEMHFLPDVYIPCDVCKGKRYNQEVLDIHYKGKNISEVLGMSVNEALEFFANIPAIQRKLVTLGEVGLGYIKLGQPAPQLSGGEAQRVKLATELSRRATGKTLYVLDEPTTGLHFDDIKRLLMVLSQLADKGNTVLVIEHNLDVIKTADWIIDLGPEGGDKGGKLVAEGTPEEVSKVKKSYTGHYLQKVLR